MAGTRHITVTGCNQVASGERDGRAWAIYEIDATDDQGRAIDLPLRAFSELPLGRAEYLVEPYTGKNGTTYTLKKPGAAGANPGARLGPKVDDLRRDHDLLARNVDHVRDRVTGLEQLVRQLLDERPAGATPVAQLTPQNYGQQPPQAANAIFGGTDDVPF